MRGRTRVALWGVIAAALAATALAQDGEFVDPMRPPRPQPAAEQRAKPTGSIVMRKHTLTDPGMRGMKSHTLLVPKGWGVEGSAWWPSQAFFKILPSQDVTVTAPDGRMVRIGPSVGASDYQPSEYAASQLGARRQAEGTASEGVPVIYLPTNEAEWKAFIREKGIAQSYPGATDVRVESVAVMPEHTKWLQQQLAPIKEQNAASNRQSAAMGVAMRSFSDGAIYAATARFSDGGKRWEMLFVFGAVYHGFDAEVGRQLHWALEPNVSFRAPEGRLESSMPVLMAISNSLRMTPEWAKMKLDHARKMNQIAAKGAADRAKIWRDSNREINRIINEGHREREAIRDETHRKVIQAIRGTDDYTTGSGGDTVTLPSDYDHIYTDGNGGYILTNDGNYDPNTDPGSGSVGWQPMQPAR